jgi:hypothetical protein
VILLWAWGVLAGGLVLTDFMRRTATSDLAVQLIELLLVLVVGVALTVITWIWLGGREAGSGG